MPIKEIAKTYRPFDGTSGCYVAVVPYLDSVNTIRGWARSIGLPMDEARESELHCTVMWSHAIPADARCNPEYSVPAELDHLEYWDGHDGDGYIVAVLNSEPLRQLHQKWLTRGCVHSFDDYTPHVTLLSKIKPSPLMFEKMVQASDRLKGSAVKFYGEQIENIKK